ncbi:hypothetical protein ACIPRL_30020 [Streptomyces sp. NPDC090085]|uniref:hypothetical protein n=1 Tax=Streptomyces sp. NPDC090085 TaxID=3365943 RepID=UPI0038255E4E
MFRLADYLEQHGRTSRRHLCPPASFWHAAHAHLTDPEDLGNLSDAADNRHRLQWAHSLRHRAADHGNTDALIHLAVLREEAGDRDGAEALARQAAEHGNTSTLYHLAATRVEAGDREGAEALARRAVDQGKSDALYHSAEKPDIFTRLWPYGVDPDGTAASPWRAPYASSGAHAAEAWTKPPRAGRSS